MFRRGFKWRSVSCIILGLLFIGTILSARGSQASIQQVVDNNILEQGKPVERIISGNESHLYNIRLNSSQFLRLVVDQRGIELNCAVYNPSGEQLIEATTMNRQQGPKTIYILSELTGNYKLDLRPTEKDSKAGRYEIKIEESRLATSQDRNHMAARKAFAEGEKLRTLTTRDALLQALEKYETVLPHWQAIGDREGEAATLNGISAICFSFGENQKGLEYLAQALKIWRTLGNRYWEVATLNSMGNAYNLIGENQKALDYYSQALLLINAVGDRKGEAVTLNGIGKVYADLGENQKALDYYNQALVLRRSTGDRRGEGITLHNLGSIYDNLLDNQKALDLYAQAIDIFQAVNDPRGEASSLNNAGRIYVDIGQFDKALDYFNRTLKLRQSIADRRGEALTLNNIGYIYLLMSEKKENSTHFIGSAYTFSNHKQQALGYLNQALPIWRSLGESHEEAATLTAIANLYATLGDYQKAREYSSLAQSIKQKQTNSSEANPAKANVAISSTPLPPPPPPPAEPVTIAQNDNKQNDNKEPIAPADSTQDSQKGEKENGRPRFTQQKPPSSTVSPQDPPKVEKPQKIDKAEKLQKPAKVEKKTEKIDKTEAVEKAGKEDKPISTEGSPSTQNGKGKYAIQIGASPDKVGAENLLNQLRNVGIECYIVQANLSGKGTFYRVRTGRFERQEEAKKAALEMKSKGLIKDFFITSD
jgi:tetratricopeptide (TPR) repeat protein